MSDLIEIAAKLRVACNGVLVGAATGSEEIQVEAINRLMDAAREAAAALEAAREDAERYRWLRSLDGSYDAAACVNINIGFDWIEQHGADLDAAIDQARRKGVAE